VIFTPTSLPGVFRIDPERSEDERGSFTRMFCREEFRAHGLAFDIVQGSVSVNRRRGTLRGMHCQAPPHAESKLIRCGRGSLFDVVVDLRPDSPTFCGYAAETLSAANGRMLFAPPGVAHGFLTLEDDTEVVYLMNEPYHPDCARGVRYDDPAFGIAWPEPVRVIAGRDRTYPDFDGRPRP